MSSDAAARDFDARFHALYQNYAQSLPGKTARLAQDWLGWLDTPTPERLRELVRQAHTLAGSGATFGFQGISATARLLETSFNQLDPAGAPTETQRITIARAIQELAITAHDQPPFPRLASTAPIRQAAPRIRPAASIWLIDRDQHASLRLAKSLEPFGYHTRRLEAGELAAELRLESPIAILAEIDSDRSDRSPARLLQELHETLANPPPVIFLAQGDDLDTRLAAIRAGGLAYLGKPVDLTQLLDLLHALSEREPASPYRVLIVDDDDHAAYHNALILARAGMETRVLADPLGLFDALREFQPELILLDLYMPGCSGLELVQAIRQNPPYIGIAIVFYSVEVDTVQHIQAVRMGGDDFLIKPMDEERLAVAIEARARRTRCLRSLMYRDSLTGLLSHVAFMDQLDRELAHAQRYGLGVCQVFIDLDHFQRINDHHGHAAGDRVLCTLARVLRQRLRRTDTIGRYGGDEFAILMPVTHIATACGIIDEIRATFFALRHSLPDGEFNTSFSAGLAEYPICTGKEMLLHAADHALQRAKGLGRNRVECYEGGLDRPASRPPSSP